MARSPRRAALVTALLAVSIPLALPCPVPTAGATTGRSVLSPSPQRTAVLSCAALTRRLSSAEKIGQMIMIAQDSGRLSPSGQRTIRRDHIGSVVLLGNSTAGVSSVRRLTDRLHRTSHPGRVSIMISTDQEGGLVQRLRGPGFSRIPNAVTQGKSSDHALRSAAGRWAGQLKRAGVDANLAPVADVVPRSMRKTNAPIGRLDRWYSSSVAVTSHKNGAFLAGMHAGHVAATAKHFPGLGRVQGNTDTATTVHDRATTRHDRDLGSFRADIEHGSDMVMMSSATYLRIDAHHPAVFSRTVVIGMLRTDLHFHGVVISDDLFGRVLGKTPAGQRGVRFVVAGGDLALVGDPTKTDAVYAGLLQRARTDAWFRHRIDQSVTRILTMKAHYGLATCAPDPKH